MEIETAPAGSPGGGAGPLVDRAPWPGRPDAGSSAPLPARGLQRGRGQKQRQEEPLPSGLGAARGREDPGGSLRARRSAAVLPRLSQQVPWLHSRGPRTPRGGAAFLPGRGGETPRVCGESPVFALPPVPPAPGPRWTRGHSTWAAGPGAQPGPAGQPVEGKAGSWTSWGDGGEDGVRGEDLSVASGAHLRAPCRGSDPNACASDLEHRAAGETTAQASDRPPRGARRSRPEQPRTMSPAQKVVRLEARRCPVHTEHTETNTHLRL